MKNRIRIRNANVNNLKKVNLDIAYGAMTILVGPSGSGKSSLAFDVLYAAAASLGKASGVYKFFRKGTNEFTVEGLPAKTIGIEQQLYTESPIASIGYFSGFLTELLNNISYDNQAAKVCPVCNGKGYLKDIAPERIVKNSTSSVTRGAFTPAVKKLVKLNKDSWRKFCSKHNCDANMEWQNLSQNIRDKVLYEGSEYFNAIIPAMQQHLLSQGNSHIRDLNEELPFYICNKSCSMCDGTGILLKFKYCKDEFTFEKLINNKLIEMEPLKYRWMKLLKLEVLNIFSPIFNLCGSEMRNLRLFMALNGLKNKSLIIVDEPTAGLLPKEAAKIADLLLDLKQRGHAVVVVEHRQELIQFADKVIAFGPGSGIKGGNVVFEGSVQEYFKSVADTKKNGSLISCPDSNNKLEKKSLNIKYLHGLFREWRCFNNFEINIPIGKWTCICGPVGSGKTTYLNAIFAVCDKTPTAWQDRSTLINRNHHEAIRRPHIVTPDPIGLHPGSTPATYIGLWDRIRDLYAEISKNNRYRFTKSHFSFNNKEGQCPTCDGYGFNKSNEGYVLCPVCKGTRYRKEILKVLYRGKNIADTNNLDVQQALQVFQGKEGISRYLECLSALLLEYLILGQPSNSLSGGESQRIKIAVELAKRYGNRTLYLLDNPCRGVGDSAAIALGEVFKQLLNLGNTVVIAENNPDIARQADWVIFLGEKKDKAPTILYEGPGNRCPGKYWNMGF